jgi:GH15 family glucan-1,4-alpha-glucosidase
VTGAVHDSAPRGQGVPLTGDGLLRDGRRVRASASGSTPRVVGLRACGLCAWALAALVGCTASPPSAGDAGAEDAGAADADPPWAPEFPGHASFETLTTSNGLLAATLIGTDGLTALDQLKPHIYARLDARTPTPDVLQQLDLGLTSIGQPITGGWLRGWPRTAMALEEGTNIIRVAQTQGGFEVETYVFAPFHHPSADESPDPLLVVLTHVTARAAALEAPALAVGGSLLVRAAGQTEETIEVSADGLHEFAGDQHLLYVPLPGAAPAAQRVAPSSPTDGPAARLAAGDRLEAFPGAGTAARVSRAPELGVGLLAPLDAARLGVGEDAWGGFVVATTPRGDAVRGEVTPATLAAAVRGFVAGRSARAILDAERAWWARWHTPEEFAPTLHPNIRRLLRQSTAVLKMGQLRERHRGHGQVLASLVPGAWNISWVRDASYAIQGLTASGHAAEARLGLEFMLNAEPRQEGGRNYYQLNYLERDLGLSLSAEYLISVTRYFGDGTEESDVNGAGPNVELDGWGLFLWALGGYVDTTGDEAFLRTHWPKVRDRVANLLLEVVNPANGLVHTDSSIWERHWARYGQGAEPETRKHFTYTTLCAIAGLRAAAGLATRLGEPELPARYRAGADALQAALLERLVVTPAELGQPMLAGNLEELGPTVRYVDQAVVEAINFGVLDGRRDVADGTLAAFDRWLAVGPHSPGYIRNDDGTTYDRQEWVMIDLRTAAALARHGDATRAKRIVEWVVDQARLNHWLIPELYDRATGDYQANTPMTGFGPGAFVLAVRAME